MSKEPNKRGSVGVVLLIAVLIAVLYVLSVGPVAWVHKNGDLGKAAPVLEVVYVPLKWLQRNSESFANFMDMYLSLWGYDNHVKRLT